MIAVVFVCVQMLKRPIHRNLAIATFCFIGEYSSGTFQKLHVRKTQYVFQKCVCFNRKYLRFKDSKISKIYQYSTILLFRLLFKTTEIEDCSKPFKQDVSVLVPTEIFQQFRTFGFPKLWNTQNPICWKSCRFSYIFFLIFLIISAVNKGSRGP